jgi:hypothetical protein
MVVVLPGAGRADGGLDRRRPVVNEQRTTKRREADRTNGHKRRLAAYVFLVALGVFGFARISHDEHRIAHDERTLSIVVYQRCLDTNAQAKALRDLVTFSLRNSDAPLPPDTPPAVVELVRRGQQQAEQLRDYTLTHITVRPCVKAAK